MLIIILILTALTIIGIVIACESWDYEFLGEIIAVIAGTILVILLIIWPVNYYSTKAEIKEYYQEKQTIQDARGRKIDSIENAALTQKIWDTNDWLANNKYWRKTIFKDMIPKEIDNLEPLK